MGTPSRILSDRFYLLAAVPGISGFQRWDELEFWITTGLGARAHRSLVVREYRMNEAQRYELADGHLAGHRPVVDAADAAAWLTSNPWQRIHPQ